jgi:hypothetical protein
MGLIDSPLPERLGGLAQRLDRGLRPSPAQWSQDGINILDAPIVILPGTICGRGAIAIGVLYVLPAHQNGFAASRCACA